MARTRASTLSGGIVDTGERLELDSAVPQGRGHIGECRTDRSHNILAVWE